MGDVNHGDVRALRNTVYFVERYDDWCTVTYDLSKNPCGYQALLYNQK